jgi:hypothetical protein
MNEVVLMLVLRTFTTRVLAIQKKQDENKPKGWQEWNETFFQQSENFVGVQGNYSSNFNMHCHFES